MLALSMHLREPSKERTDVCLLSPQVGSTPGSLASATYHPHSTGAGRSRWTTKTASRRPRVTSILFKLGSCIIDCRSSKESAICWKKGEVCDCSLARASVADSEVKSRKWYRYETLDCPGSSGLNLGTIGGAKAQKDRESRSTCRISMSRYGWKTRSVTVVVEQVARGKGRHLV